MPCWYSADGEAWHRAGKRCLPLSDLVNVGLAVNSAIPCTLYTAVSEGDRVTTYE